MDKQKQIEEMHQILLSAGYIERAELQKQVDELKEKLRLADGLNEEFFVADNELCMEFQTAIQQAVKNTAKEILATIMKVVKNTNGRICEEAIKIIGNQYDVGVE